MSINTIVILVIAMTMLILGIVLVRTIFIGAIFNIDIINDNVENEIRKLFIDENDKVTIYLSGGVANVDQGDDWGLAFGIRNVEKGTSQPSTFAWDIRVGSYSCEGLTPQEAESWILTRKTGSRELLPGQDTFVLVGFQFPETASLCRIPYDLIVTKNGQPYDQVGFDFIIN